MAKLYTVWFMKDNSRLQLDSWTRDIQDGQGNTLYRYVNGSLIPRSGQGRITVMPDGRMINDTDNTQAGYIYNYKEFLNDLQGGGYTQDPGRQENRKSGTGTTASQNNTAAYRNDATAASQNNTASYRNAASSRNNTTASRNTAAAASQNNTAASRNNTAAASQNNTTASPNTAAASSSNTAAKKWSGKKTALLVFAVLFGIWFLKDNLNSSAAYGDFRTAALTLRQALLNHDESVSLKYHTDRKYDMNTNTNLYRDLGLMDPASEDLAEIYNIATEHTGDPNGGDQLSRTANLGEGTVTFEEARNGGYNVTFNGKLSYMTTKQQEERLREEIQAIVRGLNLTGKSEYEKARAIYNWICSHVTYDYARLDDESYQMKYSAYNAVMQHTAVCDGFAQLFYRMALTAGLDARIKLNENHAWNLVRIGGLYYYCDSTWDSGLPESEYRYFLKGEYDFELHTDTIRMMGLAQSPLLNVEYQLSVSPRAYGQ